MSNDQKIKVKVSPGASSNRIVIEEKQATEKLYKIYTTQIAESGKANKAIIELLAKELNTAKSNLEIIKGKNSREKTILVRK